ncbi:MAG TPA: BNR-4 repeat-containing protein [Candidatus Brocadiia bacterium]|nr:BNR-4 repeat-containing protein [Candidatus Brocadiia bacterium]
MTWNSNVALRFAALCVAAVGCLSIAVAQEKTGLDVKDKYAVVENGAAFNLERFSVSAHVRLRGLEPPQIFVTRGERGRLFTLYLFREGVRMLVEYESGKYTQAVAEPPSVGQWTHYLGTYDGREIRIYANGKPAGQASAPGRMPQSDTPLCIGALETGESAMNGEIDKVRIWNRALSENEAAQIAADADVADGLIARFTRQGLNDATWKNLADEKLSAKLINTGEVKMIATQDDGYRCLWYTMGPNDPDYGPKYSGGLGTYCAKHYPFAVFSRQANKTFFCYGGTRRDKRELLEMVSYYDHATGKVPRPTIVLNKHTDDAHDNPVIQVDEQGHIWLFSASHGTSRPSYISRSVKPYDIKEFEMVRQTNFSYPHLWVMPGRGFFMVHTLYENGGRSMFQSSSSDGRQWNEPIRLSRIEAGHYQITGQSGSKIGVAFNFHPAGKGLDWRTNLYYMESDDVGKTWRAVDGQTITLPLDNKDNLALVRNYQSMGLLVYLKDVIFDSQGRPIILIVTGKGPTSGPQNDPRMFTTARWTGSAWEIRDAMPTDNNYDMGSLYLDSDTRWTLIAPTIPGPQPYNTGGEMAMWVTEDSGGKWTMTRQLTKDSKFNHTYARRPVNAHPDFYAFWADGHARQESECRLYFCNKAGDKVWRLPEKMEGEFAEPELVK